MIKGFARRIGYATRLLAEFWALRDGLQIAIQLGINYLEVELDAKTVVQLLLSNSNHIAAYSPLLNDCRYLLSKFRQVTVSQIFREVNRCVDWLAKRGCTMPIDFENYNVPPTPEIVAFENDDVNGLYLRRCANTLPILAS